MKVKIVFLFLFITVAFANSAYSDSYFNYISFGGTWYDANKTQSNNLDDAFCTTAAASNVLMYTGWDAGFSDSDAIFAEFLDHWASNPNIELSVRNSWSLWLNGTYIFWDNWPASYVELTDASGSGNFYPSNPFANYYHTEINQSNVLSAADNFLHNGYGVTLTIQVPNNIMQHTVTLWGYDYDAGNYLGIWITDSDDYYLGPNNPQPKLSYYTIDYDQSGQKWLIDNYQIATCPGWGSNFYIQSVAALEQNPNPVATPEPATMLLLGSGLLGLAGYGRKKFFKK